MARSNCSSAALTAPIAAEIPLIAVMAERPRDGVPCFQSSAPRNPELKRLRRLVAWREAERPFRSSNGVIGITTGKISSIGGVMSVRATHLFGLLAAAGIGTKTIVSAPHDSPSPRELIAHEWGTFTT